MWAITRSQPCDRVWVGTSRFHMAEVLQVRVPETSYHAQHMSAHPAQTVCKRGWQTSAHYEYKFKDSQS